MPRPKMVSIDFSRELDARLEALVPENYRGKRRTRQRVEYVIEQFVEAAEAQQQPPEQREEARRKFFRTNMFG